MLGRGPWAAGVRGYGQHGGGSAEVLRFSGCSFNGPVSVVVNPPGPRAHGRRAGPLATAGTYARRARARARAAAPPAAPQQQPAQATPPPRQLPPQRLPVPAGEDQQEQHKERQSDKQLESKLRAAHARAAAAEDAVAGRKSDMLLLQRENAALREKVQQAEWREAGAAATAAQRAREDGRCGRAALAAAVARAERLSHALALKSPPGFGYREMHQHMASQAQQLDAAQADALRLGGLADARKRVIRDVRTQLQAKSELCRQLQGALLDSGGAAPLAPPAASSCAGADDGPPAPDSPPPSESGPAAPRAARPAGADEGPPMGDRAAADAAAPTGAPAPEARTAAARGAPLPAGAMASRGAPAAGARTTAAHGAPPPAGAAAPADAPTPGASDGAQPTAAVRPPAVMRSQAAVAQPAAGTHVFSCDDGEEFQRLAEHEAGDVDVPHWPALYARFLAGTATAPGGWAVPAARAWLRARQAAGHLPVWRSRAPSAAVPRPMAWEPGGRPPGPTPPPKLKRAAAAPPDDGGGGGGRRRRAAPPPQQPPPAAGPGPAPLPRRGGADPLPPCSG